MTHSMERAISETNRRRKIQMEYNAKHGITPKTIIKDVRDVIEIGKATDRVINKHSKDNNQKTQPKLTRKEKERLIDELTKQMKEASKRLEFEQAAFIRDKIKEIRNL